MKKLRIIGIVFLIAIGIVVLGFITGFFSIPTIKKISNKWGTISESTSEIKSSITIENDNIFNINIPQVQVDLLLKMNDIEMAQGTIDHINLLQGETEIQVSSYLDNSKITQWWVSHIENNETTIIDIEPSISIDVTFSEPRVEIPARTIPMTTHLLEAFNTLTNKTIQIGPGSITVKSVTAQWGLVDTNITELMLVFLIYNPLPFDIPMPELDYNFSMNTITLGKGDISNNISLQAYSDTFIELPIKIDTTLIDDWFVTHLQNNETSTLSITVSSAIEYAGINYEIDDLLLFTYQFQTDLLGAAI